MKNSYKYRDLFMVDLGREEVLVVACDAAGGIGPKEADVVKVPGYVLGRLTARVALMEVTAVGAHPVCVVSALCMEPEPTGREVNEGVADELRVLGLDPGRMMTGSAEKNVPTIQSGIGVTVVGVARREELRIGRLRDGDAVVVFGLPKVGREVFLEDPEIADLSTVKLLLSCDEVREIVPLGSRGIWKELQELASLYDFFFEAAEKEYPGLDLFKSCGPATCLIAAGEVSALKELGAASRKPFRLLGYLRRSS